MMKINSIMNFYLVTMLLIALSPPLSATIRFSNVDCSNLFRGFLKPHSCCYYPFINVSELFCSPKCAEKLGNPCCVYDCVARNLNLYENGKFNGENLMKSYEKSIREKWEVAGDKWLPVIRENINSCIEIVPPLKVYEEHCSTPYFTTQIQNCVTKRNFVNCPTLVNSKECHRLRYFIRHLEFCGEFINNEYFIHRDHFMPHAVDDHEDHEP